MYKGENKSAYNEALEAAMPVAFVAGYAAAIEQVVSSSIVQEARQIVSAHKQPDLPEGFEVYNLGLKRQHHEELRSKEFDQLKTDAKQTRYNELRQEYESDPEAQEQIDIYNHESPYTLKMREYMDAMASNNTRRQAEIEVWLKQNYPITFKDILLY